MAKSKMAAIVGDVTGPQQRQTSIKYTSYCREDQTLSTEGKTVSKYCKISKTLGGGGVQSTPICTTVGVWIYVYVRVLIEFY